MNDDIETIRMGLQDALDPRPYEAALGRIEVALAAAKVQNDGLFESETRLQAEVDRLRAKYEFLLSENEGHATEVERLQGYKDEAEKFLASYRIEVERLQKAEKAWTETARIYAVNDADRHAEIERLRGELDRMTGEARKWHDRAENNAIQAEGLLRRIEYLESEKA